jgi:hypothetical protein
MKLKLIKAMQDGWEILIENLMILFPASFLALIGIVFSEAFQPPEEEVLVMVDWLLTNLPAILPLSLLTLFFTAMIVRLAYDATRKNLSLAKATEVVLGKFPILFLASLLFLFLTTLGFLALFIPGIFIAMKLSFFDCAILIDEDGVISSLKRSWEITKGNWWKVFALFLIFTLIIGIPLGFIDLLPREVSLPITFFFSLLLGAWSQSSFTLAYLQLRK